MKKNENIHISLAIDSNNNTSFDLNPNEDLDILCQNIAKNYNLSLNIEKNLKKYLEIFILEEEKKKIEKKKILKQKASSSVLKLYYQSMNDLKKKKQCLNKLKEDKFDEFVNTFPFRPKILFNKSYERNYYKIEEKLVEDGKKCKEKLALKRIVKEIENRKIIGNKQRKKLDNLKIGNSRVVKNEEKKCLFQNDNINPNSTTFKNNFLINTSVNNSNNDQTTNNLLNPFGNIIDKNPIMNNTNLGKYPQNSSNKILIFNENNKNFNTPTPKFQIPSNFLPNSQNLNLRQTSILTNHINPNIETNKSKNVLSSAINNLDTSIKKDSLPLNKMSLFNNKNFNSYVNTLQTNSSTNSRYAEQYLKQKNNLENVLIKSRVQSSSNSQRKNDSSERLSQDDNDKIEVKPNKELLCHKNSTSNQLIQTFKTAKNLNTCISIKKDAKAIRDKSKTTYNKEVIYCKKVIKKNKINKNENLKKTFSMNYRFKDLDKENKNHLDIYENCKLREKSKEKHFSLIKLSEYSFKPTLTEGSKKLLSKSLSKYENKEEYFRKLSNSKMIKNLNSSLEKRNKSMNCILVTQNSQKNVVKRSSSYKSTLTNKLITTSEETDLKSYKNTLTEESSRIREVKKSKELIENIKNQQSKENNIVSNCTNKILDNINKYKLNNLKEIFEIIYHNCSNIDDIQNIENYGINLKIKDKLILPTCHIMKERNLEFNFQNFFLISNEIINFTIDV